MQYFPTLYKTTSTGKEQCWKIGYDVGYIETSYGQVGGKIQFASMIVKGKNIGKTNETTPLEQASLEAHSKWKKQLDKGYSEVRGGASMAYRPMLAHSFDKYKHKLTYPVYVQPKLDGVRCIAVCDSEGKITLRSRQNKTFDILDHIVSALEQIMAPGEIWDGEIYIHRWKFQDLISLIKRKQENTTKLEYHVYDTITDETYEHRRAKLQVLELLRTVSPLHIVTACLASNETEVRECHNKLVAAGYEGAIIRTTTGLYKAGYRSQDLLKLKAFMDEEFEIVAAYENRGKQRGQCTFSCRTKDGALFDCKPEGTTEQREEYWRNKDKYIGQMLTVRFFRWSTSAQKVPIFPIGVMVRLYE